MITRTLLRTTTVTLGLVLTTGTASALTMGKTVTVIVDGEERMVYTFSSSVSGALQSAGLAVDDNDTLAPTADSEIDDGSRIVLKRGRPLILTVDGVQREVWTTALTVEGALRQLKMPTDDVALSADRSRPIPLHGMALEVRVAKPVTFIDGGLPPREVQSAAPSVAEFLAEQGVPLRELDTVAPEPTTPLLAGMTVEVTRIRVEERTERRTVSPPVEEIEDPELPYGEEIIEERGAPGEELVTYRVTVVNGADTERDELATEPITPAQPQRIRVGTRKSPAVADGSVWDELAECEASGNWSANTGNGYYGGLQFNKSTWDAYDGDQYAAYPHQASREEQIATAERVRADRGGYGAWPSCSSQLGLS